MRTIADSAQALQVDQQEDALVSGSGSDRPPSAAFTNSNGDRRTRAQKRAASLPMDVAEEIGESQGE